MSRFLSLSKGRPFDKLKDRKLKNRKDKDRKDKDRKDKDRKDKDRKDSAFGDRREQVGGRTTGGEQLADVLRRAAQWLHCGNALQ